MFRNHRRRLLLFGGSGAAPAVVDRLATINYGPGYSTGAALPTGDGTLKSFQGDFINNSGAPLHTIGVVLQGWSLSTSGTLTAGADLSTSGTIEFPAGTQVGTVSAFTNVAGSNTRSADVTLSSDVPAGSSFRVKLSATPTNGVTYIANLGFAGVVNKALNTTMKKLAIAGFGDSLMTNNSGPLFNAAGGRCGAYLNSIGGTTAQSYGASGAANFLKQADLAAKLGCTHVMSNFGTNDAGAGTSNATLQGYLTAMRDAVRAKGVKFAQCTMLPRTLQANAQLITSFVATGTTATIVVPDATRFIVGRSYIGSGANEAAFNTIFFCTAINSGTNTLTMLFPGGTTTATGGPALNSQTPSAELSFMQPFATYYNFGTGVGRTDFNTWVRSGVFDDYFEWADACEHARDDGRWRVHGDDSLLAETQLVTVSSVISTSRFNSNYSRGNNTVANGFVQALTGANIGQFNLGNGNTAGDITCSAAWGQTQQIGDQYWVWPGSSYMSDDGTHPRVAVGGQGGQPHLDNATSGWIDARL